mmetsp:Transcript_71761/g.83425  ORF Transcript_71761/g.83425 Transcript_71761/m.83425 type:complete len:312 (+) Transcript_71761:40-975(+)|eukprot:CAMPEP_0176419012 /NCGR_PEP_ID=MMETSP0127-20121128/7803_1 /TAXON_ID=938130 /ORGANISM="Platyophrya macrostoma, Strain WH" /LENGTH=311 /DNA_ID=CAMNT_0017799427 /DNA_START=39 /DNA_END=974 /DNA_ORIENTATION=-
MLRRVTSVSTTGAAVATMLSSSRSYRLIPHIDLEIEELAETQKLGRWQISHKNTLQQPLRKAEIMVDKLNFREKRRTGILPEKSIARKLSQVYAKDGKVQDSHYQVKLINITIVGFDGHPFHFRVPPMPDTTLNNLIDGSGMCHGHSNQWGKCNNPSCEDFNHGDGCLVNVDIETLDRLPPPNRFEYTSLAQWRMTDRADITYNTRFSCQIPIVPELDGGLFAMKQYWSRSLRESATHWFEHDNYATGAVMRSKKIEPWAPIIEEPTKRDYPITFDMLWANSYQEIMSHKDADYRRKDGFHTTPKMWAAYV